jgi:hypothetical protein
MPSNDSESVAVDARRIDDDKLHVLLEEGHLHEFVAIEPVSGNYFFGPDAECGTRSVANQIPPSTGTCDSCWTQGGASFWHARSLNGLVDANGRALVTVEVRPTEKQDAKSRSRCKRR